MSAGEAEPFTEDSLGKLAELVPGRYAKDEMSSGFLATIDSYVYRSPVPQVSGPTLDSADTRPPGEPAQTTQLTPLAVDDGEVEYASP